MGTSRKQGTFLSFSPLLVMGALFMAGVWLPAAALPPEESADSPQREAAVPNPQARAGRPVQAALVHHLPDDMFMLPPRALDLNEDDLALLAQLVQARPELAPQVAELGPDVSPQLLQVWLRMQTIAVGQGEAAPEARDDSQGGPDRNPRAGTMPA